jgi:perosamine synthetase
MKDEMIPIYKTYRPANGYKCTHDAIDSGWFSIGKYNEEAVYLLQEKFGYKYVLLTSSGTAANHLMVECLKWMFPKHKKVLVPNNTYVAAWNPFLFSRHHSLYSLDTNLDTWNVDLKDPSLHDEGQIFLAVHNLGNPIDVSLVRSLYPRLLIVEDNCEGLGGVYSQDKYTGTDSVYSTLSFYSNKNIGIGEGGAFITKDKASYQYALMLHGQGQSDQKYVHNVLGYNYRMTNIQAALLCDQLQSYEEIMNKKTRVFDFYCNCLYEANMKLQQVSYGCKHSKWMLGVRIIGSSGYHEAEEFFRARGIETRPMFYPINTHHHLRRIAGNGSRNALLLSSEGFMIPSYPDLTDEQLEHIVNTVRAYSKEV